MTLRRAALTCLCVVALAAAKSAPVKRQADGASDQSSQADGSQDAESAGRNPALFLRSIRSCPGVDDDAMYTAVKDIKLERTGPTEYQASGAISQQHIITCDDRFSMNFTLFKQDNDDQSRTAPMVSFEADNVTKFIEEYPEESASFFEASNFPKGCPFEVDVYSVTSYVFDIKAIRKFLPDSIYKIVLIGYVNQKKISCSEVEFLIETRDDEEEEEEEE